MDEITACYRTKMRLWSDSDEETPVRWFKADPGAKWFPGEHVFGSSDYLEPPRPGPLGEVLHRVKQRRGRRLRPEDGCEDWSARIKFDQGKNPLGYKGLDYCGPAEAFLEGGRHGSGPVFVTTAGGGATCCGDLVPTTPADWCLGWTWSARVRRGKVASPAWCLGWAWSAQIAATTLDLQDETGAVIQDETGASLQIDV